MPSQIVVWDSSVLIPMILRKSKSTALHSRLASAGWSNAVTPQILAEVRERFLTKPSLRKWLGLSDEEISEFIDEVPPALLRVYPGVVEAQGAVPDDPDDDIIVAAALESHADYILTEDNHLLRLRTYQGIDILNRDMLARSLDQGK